MNYRPSATITNHFYTAKECPSQRRCKPGDKSIQIACKATMTCDFLTPRARSDRGDQSFLNQCSKNYFNTKLAGYRREISTMDVSQPSMRVRLAQCWLQLTTGFLTSRPSLALDPTDRYGLETTPLSIHNILSK